MAVEYEPFGAAWREDPYPTYRALREHDPVHWAPEAACFCVSRYEDAVFVLRHPDLFSSEAMRTMLANTKARGPLWRQLLAVAEFLARTGINPFALQRTPNLITSDPPRHDVMRAIVNRGFTPRRIRGVIAERRRRPGEDLVSVIVAGQDGEATLSELEVFQFVLVLLVAGNETTTNLIGNAVQALLDDPEQLELVCESPELVPNLVEEALRFDPPIQMLFRTATRDVEIAGVRVPAGAVVAPLLAAANRDERRFPDGERFDVTRDAQGHLAFGFGAHFCLGASLARLEAAAALAALVPELPRLARADSGRTLVDSFLVRGLTRLELVPSKPLPA